MGHNWKDIWVLLLMLLSTSRMLMCPSLRTFIKADSLAMRSLAGAPTLQQSLVKPSARWSASWPSTTRLLAALDRLQTKNIAHHFEVRLGFALVGLFLPGTYVVMGPYRSAWVTQKGGARV